LFCFVLFLVSCFLVLVPSIYKSENISETFDKQKKSHPQTNQQINKSTNQGNQGNQGNQINQTNQTNQNQIY